LVDGLGIACGQHPPRIDKPLELQTSTRAMNHRHAYSELTR
jgi:hypothetical protein